VSDIFEKNVIYAETQTYLKIKILENRINEKL